MNTTMQKHSPHRQACGNTVPVPPRGFVSLIAVIIVGAVGLSVAVFLLLNGIDSMRASFAGEQSSQARALADACAEHALGLIREQTSYTGTDGLTLGGGTCTYIVTSQGGQNRTITSTGTVAAMIRKVRIVIDAITPDITIASWQEVADF